MLKKFKTSNSLRTKRRFVERLKNSAPTSVHMMWGVARKHYFWVLGWVANLFLGPLSAANPFDTEKLPLDRVAVLGRGKSCELFVAEAQKQDFSAVILCNFEDRELASSDLCDAIRRVPYVILLAKLEEPSLSFRLAKSLGVNMAVITRREHPPLIEESATWKDNPLRRRRVWRLSRLGLQVQPLPEQFSPRLESEGMGTGMMGVAMGSVLSDKVEMFGIEFYRTDYISGDYETMAGETGEIMHLRPRSHVYQQGFEHIATQQAHVQFRLHGYGDHSIGQKNVTIMKVELGA